MIPLDEARATVRAGVRTLEPREVALSDALGHVLAAPAFAVVDVPPFANSAMDGYAVRAADVEGAPVTLDVVGRVLAGSALATGVGPGQAARIMTGAPVPDGADAVCMVERTHPADGDAARPEHARKVVIEAAVAEGENVRAAGGDVGAGDVVLEAGAMVGPTQLAALLSAGCARVTVHPRPRVGVISTGDELVDLPVPLGPAQIYDSNRPMLLALVAEAGCVPVDLGRSPDDETELAARIVGGLAAVDALVLSGGVSVGDVDVVRAVLDDLGGAATRWMQIAIRPAKPFSFAVLDGPAGPVPAFGLPGNPVSSAVSFELLVRPALRAMAGDPGARRARLRARAAEPLRRRPDGRLHLVRVRLRPETAPEGPAADGGPTSVEGWSASPCPGQASHQIRSMALADGLALLPDGEGVDEGGMVEVLVTNPVLGSALEPAR
jgi:molybdopterin molybdotransferase